MNFLKNKKVMGFLVFLVIVIILAVSLSSGALKFNITATRTPSTETTTTTGNEFETEQSVTKMPQKQKPVLADRATTFKNAEGNLEFSIRLPIGWAVAEDERLDFVAGSLVSEKLPDGGTFNANINAIVGTHPSGFSTFSDYQEKWKNDTLAEFPSMEVVSDYATSIGNMDVYVIEVDNAHPNGMLLRQIQYIFYVTDTHAMIVTVTAPLNSWETYDEATKKSVESIEQL